MKATLAKVRRTDFRQKQEAAKAAAWAPLERGQTARDVEAKAHDKAVATLAPETVLAAARDLGKRGCWDYRDPEHRWSLGRLAALARRIDRDRNSRQTTR